jgi:hypothetical protein
MKLKNKVFLNNLEPPREVGGGIDLMTDVRRLLLLTNVRQASCLPIPTGLKPVENMYTAHY